LSLSKRCPAWSSPYASTPPHQPHRHATNFEPATTRFSATNAESPAVAATIAYEANNTTAKRRVEKELGLDQFFEPFEHHNFVIDTEGFVTASKQHVVLAFGGTEPGKIKDRATDALTDRFACGNLLARGCSLSKSNARSFSFVRTVIRLGLRNENRLAGRWVARR
jgi:hypothetical protein